MTTKTSPGGKKKTAVKSNTIPTRAKAKRAASTPKPGSKKPRKDAVKKAGKPPPAKVKKQAVAKRKVGRPTSYRVAFAKQARKLCLLGLTDVEMAGVFDVSEATFYNWKKKVPQFLEALIEGKVVADANVAQSLYHRAIGYEHPETHISMNKGKVQKTQITRRYPPDTSAAIMWLKNRQGILWRDQRDFNVGGQGPDNPMMILARAVQGRPLLPAKQQPQEQKDD